MYIEEALVETQAEIRHEAPRVLSRENWMDDFGLSRTPKYRTIMPTFESSTERDWRALEPLLAGIDALYHEWTPEKPNMRPSSVGRVARVEFIFKRDTSINKEYRGAVLFDNWGRPILHAMHALLGYSGAGPGLSKQILDALGVSREMFDEANSSVTADEYYCVVFSREAIGVVIGHHSMGDDSHHAEPTAAGTPSSYPGAPVSSTWKWWIA